MAEGESGTQPAAGMEPAAPHGVVDIAGWLREAWGIFKGAPLVFILLTAVFFLLIAIASVIPLGSFLVGGPLAVGYYLVVADAAQNREFNIWRLFEGFKFFLPALAAYFSIAFFTVVGLILLIIPGLIVAAWYLFTYLFIADRGFGFWRAMESSRALVRQDTVGFVFFFLAMIAVNILGALCLVIGLLASVPVTYIAIFVAYRKLVGLQKLAEAPGPAPVTI